MAFGTYKEVVCARSTDKDIQKVSQDGGIVTALFAYALEENIIEGAIVAGDTEDPWKPEPNQNQRSCKTKRSRKNRYCRYSLSNHGT